MEKYPLTAGLSFPDQYGYDAFITFEPDFLLLADSYGASSAIRIVDTDNIQNL
ncbi:hypothetical protein [Methylobacter sp. YRD-M1]|uniref:hypothetical protein n=1 Tax=Methylobacter sp. YRD-M1 TaxID=2911520 RepID=UPI00227D6572|nr:hypothetical protein [Methylobacter sp. YRD-M1]WAK03451.1 hypothetical protein LZ558_06645 [Methylobacter sp. YRD-M1]